MRYIFSKIDNLFSILQGIGYGSASIKAELSSFSDFLNYKSKSGIFIDIGSISENAGFGIWAKYGDLESILKKIQFFESNVSKRIEMGEAGHSFFIKNYDVKITFNKISKFVNQ